MKGEIMQQELTCNQVVALLTYFVENKLNKQLAHDIEYHLSICPECKKKKSVVWE